MVSHHITTDGTSSTQPPALEDSYPVQKLEEDYFAYGDHADVYRGRYRGQLVAIKQLRGVNTNKFEIRDKILSDLKERYVTWKNLDSPNVCKVHKIAGEFGFLPALILDYYPRGNIFKYIQKQNPPMDQRIRWVADIASGLAYLHYFDVYHGDLRGANIFLDHNYRAVIADYGIADFFVHSDFTSAKSTATVRWTAPEVIAIPPDPNIRMDKVDVFALGMTMLEIFSGEPPFSDKSDTGAIFAIAKNETPKLPENVTGNAYFRSLFFACTETQPEKRPSAQTATDILLPLVPPRGLFQRVVQFISSWVGYP